MNDAQFGQFMQQLRGRSAGMQLQTFTSGDSVEWRDFKTHFVTLCEHHEWPDLTRRRQLKAAMTKDAAARVRDIEVDTYNNIDDMLNAFESRFVPQAEAMIVKAEFDQARQNPTERLMDWHSRLRAIFIRAYPNRNAANDDQLIRTFIAGLNDPAIKMFVLEGAPETYVAALTRAQNKEAMLLTVKNMGQMNLGGNRRGHINQIGMDEAISIEDAINAFVQQGDGKRGICFFCRKPGHFVKDCIILKRAEVFLRKYRELQNQRGKGQKNKNKNKNKNSPATVNSMEAESVEQIELPAPDASFAQAIEDLPDSFFEDIQK